MSRKHKRQIRLAAYLLGLFIAPIIGWLAMGYAIDAGAQTVDEQNLWEEADRTFNGIVTLSTGASIDATGAGGQNLTAATAKNYTFGAGYQCRRVVVSHYIASGATSIKVAFNKDDGTTYDMECGPDGYIASPLGLQVTSLRVISDANLTYDTDFVIKGWK